MCECVFLCSCMQRWKEKERSNYTADLSPLSFLCSTKRTSSCFSSPITFIFSPFSLYISFSPHLLLHRLFSVVLSFLLPSFHLHSFFPFSFPFLIFSLLLFIQTASFSSLFFFFLFIPPLLALFHSLMSIIPHLPLSSSLFVPLLCFLLPPHLSTVLSPFMFPSVFISFFLSFFILTLPPLPVPLPSFLLSSCLLPL